MSNTSRPVYALALGSNRPLSARRTPARLLDEVVAMIGRIGYVIAVSPAIVTAPVGPSRRVYANRAMLVESALPPAMMLARLQEVERLLGRRRFRRWGERSMDIDIILWSGGCWASRELTVPHPGFRTRAFVLTPLATIAPCWRDPLSGLTVRHLRARLRKSVKPGA